MVYDQTRINDAIRTGTTKNSSDTLVFCPNFLSTKEIFDVLNESHFNYLIYGGYGISKTISIILFNHLVSIKCKFLIEASTDHKKKDELKNLIASSLIKTNNTSKCWYWTIDWTKLK
jgi:hypothetical protein